MKFVIAKTEVKIDYKSNEFWKQFDEIEVENPTGWYVLYVTGGMVHKFDYCQSTGRGDYYDEYVEEEHKIPLPFTADAKANAEIMHKANYDGFNNVTLVYEP